MAVEGINPTPAEVSASQLPCHGPQAADCSIERLNLGAALYDHVIRLLNEEESIASDRRGLLRSQAATPSAQTAPKAGLRKGSLPGRNHAATRSSSDEEAHVKSHVFAKAAMYTNSRLPAELPPLQIYLPTWPLICLAARHSLHAYYSPQEAEDDTYIEADRQLATKAMVIKSEPVDDKNAVVFAIRGTQTFADWVVNLDNCPVSPAGFLDDAGNLCHRGFLEVAVNMVEPVASRLRQMLEENPNRRACSLIITGHSAGGAVASLLYSHMLGQTVKSELNNLVGCFKRVHCVTFGAPPVSVRALSKPAGRQRGLAKCVFFSFINEGDPVTRADMPYIRSLLKLYRTDPPECASQASTTFHNTMKSSSKLILNWRFWNDKSGKGRKSPKRPVPMSAAVSSSSPGVVWKVPAATLSNAGRLVLLRTCFHEGSEDVKALIAQQEQLNMVIFGDPLMHQMTVYSRRVEILAIKAVTGSSMT